MNTHQRETRNARRQARIAAARTAVANRKVETGDPFDREYIAQRQAETAAIDARIRAQVKDIASMMN